ncbi:hypothetical protein MuYL_0202 [Mucilaginibacter xinganensis]|uniref:Uncharacterized protein n=1 Tax=Mucilaginibacter xinganensis TaxID=1234841 RepID=A0A223NQB3_9SPHI|nr:hypothetical protein MuYL_0202 [Mucilaginibacter xinganensis]
MQAAQPVLLINLLVIATIKQNHYISLSNYKPFYHSSL